MPCYSCFWIITKRCKENDKLIIKNAIKLSKIIVSYTIINNIKFDC